MSLGLLGAGSAGRFVCLQSIEPLCVRQFIRTLVLCVVKAAIATKAHFLTAGLFFGQEFAVGAENGGQVL